MDGLVSSARNKSLLLQTGAWLWGRFGPSCIMSNRTVVFSGAVSIGVNLRQKTKPWMSHGDGLWRSFISSQARARACPSSKQKAMSSDHDNRKDRCSCLMPGAKMLPLPSPVTRHLQLAPQRVHTRTVSCLELIC